jgi:myo-inositol-1(or 4)-monophosphatase
MLALVDSGEVVFSAIYDFLHDEMYSAEKGKGAFKNNDPIRVSERPLSSAFVSFETRVEVPENADLRNTIREMTDLVTTFSSGWEFAMVASGKIDARICKDPYGMDYDFAPGTLLVSEAGGIVRNIGSNNFDYQNLNFIASNPVVYKDLTEGKAALFPIN